MTNRTFDHSDYLDTGWDTRLGSRHGKLCSNFDAAERLTLHAITRDFPPGFLGQSDQLMLAVLAVLATPLYVGEPISKGDLKTLTRLAAKFGFTVGDRCLIQDAAKQARIIKRNEKAGCSHA